MFCRGRKGLSPMLVIAILLVFFGISFFLFLVFFQYTIRVGKIQTVSKSRESLLFLSIINNEYSSGENFVLSLSNNTETTTKEIYDYIKNFNDFKDPESYGALRIKTGNCYYYNFGSLKYATIICESGKCTNIDPLKCNDYTYIIKMPIPIIYDGKDFKRDIIFISFV
ncbi:MAG: hypothetical protein QXZ43_02720 [Candidatus Aenigmatarchaeota archaeon]